MKRAVAISLILMLLFCGSAYAADISDVYISDIDQSILTVKGNADSTEKTINVVILKKGQTLSEGIFHYKEASVQKVTVEDNTFTASFKFTPEEGIYTIHVPNGETYDFEYINKNSVLSFVSDLGQKKIPKDQIFDLLERYAESMGIRVSYANTQVQRNYVANSFIKYADEIKRDGIDGCKRIVKRSENELLFFEKLEKTAVQANVNTLLQEYANEIGVSLTDYEKLSDNAKVKVLSAFVGQKYSDMERFKTDFYDSVKKMSNPPATAAPSGGGGGTGGGGAYNIISTNENNNQNNPQDPLKITDYFSDIEHCSWAWDAISFVREKGIMVGMGEGIFAPEQSLTREQLAKIIVLAFGYYDENARCNFSDIPKDNWAQSYVASALNNGLMIGYDSEHFGYGQPMTRQDICVVMYRAAQKKGVLLEADGEPFLDDSDISEYAKEAISKLTGALIVYGMGDRTFRPQTSVNRAQAANLIYLLMSKMQ